MKRTEIKIIFLGLLLTILAIFVIVAYFSGNSSVSDEIPDDLSEENYCDIDNRPEICTAIYLPVCAWSSEDEQIGTFASGCTACSDAEVAYWTEGEC